MMVKGLEKPGPVGAKISFRHARMVSPLLLDARVTPASSTTRRRRKSMPNRVEVTEHRNLILKDFPLLIPIPSNSGESIGSCAHQLPLRAYTLEEHHHQQLEEDNRVDRGNGEE
jgi:hypothetical protein